MPPKRRRPSRSTTLSLVPPQNHGNVRVSDRPPAVPKRRYKANLTACRDLSSRPPVATAEEITKAEIYRPTVINRHCCAEQGNLNQNPIADIVLRDEVRQAMEEFGREMRQSMEESLQELQQSMEETRRQYLKEIRQSLVTATNPVLINSTRTYNTGRGTGAHREYPILPFIIEGEHVNPDAIEPPIPLLKSLDVIEGLGNNQLNRYLVHYHIRARYNHRRIIKLQRLRQHLGVVVN